MKCIQGLSLYLNENVNQMKKPLGEDERRTLESSLAPSERDEVEAQGEIGRTIQSSLSPPFPAALGSKRERVVAENSLSSSPSLNGERRGEGEILGKAYTAYKQEREIPINCQNFCRIIDNEYASTSVVEKVYICIT